jgi:hypothetical protein
VERCLFLRRSRASTDQGRKDFLRCVRFTDQNCDTEMRKTEHAPLTRIPQVQRFAGWLRNGDLAVTANRDRPVVGHARERLEQVIETFIWRIAHHSVRPPIYCPDLDLKI